MDNIILSPIELGVLLESVRAIVKDEIRASQVQQLDEKLLNSMEVCKHFSISRVTLGRWTKEGRIQEHRIGSRVYFKYSDVMKSLETIQKYKKAQAS